MNKKNLFVVFIIVYCVALGVVGCQNTDKASQNTASSASPGNPVSNTNSAPMDSSANLQLDAHAYLVNFLNTYGISYSVDEDNLIVNIDESTALSMTPALIKQGFYQDWVTQAWLNSRPVMTAVGLLLGYLNFPIMETMRTHDIAVLNISAYIIYPDEYGNHKKNLAFTCQIDRKLYNKINWINFDTRNIPRLFHNFQYSNWYFKRAYRENTGRG